MEYIYYKYKKGNFGDELNGWLWPQFFGPNVSAQDENYFLGIGTILNNNISLIKELSPERNKIVFGSGVRMDYETLLLDKKWDIRFLRGPLSSFSLKNQYEYIADAAYALRLTEKFDSFQNIEKKYEISYMPYFMSNQYFDWKEICNTLGFNYISPLNEFGIEHTLREIASSKYIISEAMHGAIVADIFRVPWHRVILSAPDHEGPMVSEFKWMDWLFSIEQNYSNLTQVNFFRESFDNWFYWKTIGNRYVKNFTNSFVKSKFLVKSSVKADFLAKIQNISNFNLSSDSVIERIDDKMFNQIKKLQQDIIK